MVIYYLLFLFVHFNSFILTILISQDSLQFRTTCLQFGTHRGLGKPSLGFTLTYLLTLVLLLQNKIKINNTIKQNIKPVNSQDPLCPQLHLSIPSQAVTRTFAETNTSTLVDTSTFVETLPAAKPLKQNQTVGLKPIGWSACEPGDLSPLPDLLQLNFIGNLFNYFLLIFTCLFTKLNYFNFATYFNYFIKNSQFILKNKIRIKINFIFIFIFILINIPLIMADKMDITPSATKTAKTNNSMTIKDFDTPSPITNHANVSNLISHMQDQQNENMDIMVQMLITIITIIILATKIMKIAIRKIKIPRISTVSPNKILTINHCWN